MFAICGSIFDGTRANLIESSARLANQSRLTVCCDVLNNRLVNIAQGFLKAARVPVE